MRTKEILWVTGFVCCLATSPSIAKNGAKSYQAGKLLDVQVQDVNRGVAVIGSVTAPIPGLLYVFQIQSDDLTYFATYSAGKLSYKPDWVANDPIEFRLDKGAMFLKRSDGKELEVKLVKRERTAKDEPNH